MVSSLSAQEAGFRWKQGEESVALLNGEKIVWQLNHSKSQDKPYFHPLCTVDGDELTALRPKDHVWHRALWFSWKFINGLNYWEENASTLLSKGRTEIVSVEVKAREDYSARIEMKLSYHPQDGAELMSEKRTIDVSAPRDDGTYDIDWEAEFTATGGDVLLDRTPIEGEPDGKSWGGYAGLSLRMARETIGWNITDSAGNAGSAINRKEGITWVGMSGKTSSGSEAGVAVFDHPSNARHPSPWYVIPNMPYFSPAILYKESIKLEKGKSLALKYRIIIHRGLTDRKSLEKEWKSFSAE